MVIFKLLIVRRWQLGKDFHDSFSRFTCILPMECICMVKENLRMYILWTVKSPRHQCQIKKTLLCIRYMHFQIFYSLIFQHYDQLCIVVDIVVAQCFSLNVKTLTIQNNTAIHLVSNLATKQIQSQYITARTHFKKSLIQMCIIDKLQVLMYTTNSLYWQ